MRLERIAVGMDFSEAALAAASWTSRHFAPGTELALVHSVYVPTPPAFLQGRFPASDTLIENATRGAEMRMKEVSLALGGRIWPEVRVGDPAEQIEAVATELDVDLIVVGPHGERPGIWSMLGSTAQHLVERSRTPVLLARGLPAGPPRRLLVAIDDSPTAERALAWALFLAKRFDAPLTVLHVVSPAIYGAVQIASSEKERRSAIASLREAGEAWLAKRIARESLEGVNATTELVFGDPRYEVLSAAHRAGTELVLVGRAGTRGMSGKVIGSTASAVLRGGGTPVLVATD